MGIVEDPIAARCARTQVMPVPVDRSRSKTLRCGKRSLLGARHARLVYVLLPCM